MKQLGTIFALLTISTLCATAAHAQLLLHSYAFDNGAADGTGTANGSLLGGATVSGGVLNLDGLDDYVQFSEKIVPTSGSYTVALFARQAVAQSNVTEFISQGFSGGPGFYMGFDGNGRIRLTDSWTNAYAAPAVGGWHHYALVVGNGVSQFYLDGVLANTLGSQIATTNGGTNSRFGKQFDGYSEFFSGSLDNVTIYSGALSGSQVAALAAAGPSIVPEAGTVLLFLPVLPMVGMAITRRRK